MLEFAVQHLLESPTVTIRDVHCQGSCRHQSAEECATATELVFPFRGVYVRHLGHDQAVAEANQVLFFNATEGCRVAMPVCRWPSVTDNRANGNGRDGISIANGSGSIVQNNMANSNGRRGIGLGNLLSQPSGSRLFRLVHYSGTDARRGYDTVPTCWTSGIRAYSGIWIL